MPPDPDPSPTAIAPHPVPTNFAYGVAETPAGPMMWERITTPAGATIVFSDLATVQTRIDIMGKLTWQMRTGLVVPEPKLNGQHG